MSGIKICPKCKKGYLELVFQKCLFCSGGQYYLCNNLNCYSKFEIKDKDKVGKELKVRR